MASGDQREALSEAIRAHLSVLGNRRLRLKWEKVMNGGCLALGRVFRQHRMSD